MILHVIINSIYLEEMSRVILADNNLKMSFLAWNEFPSQNAFAFINKNIGIIGIFADNSRLLFEYVAVMELY